MSGCVPLNNATLDKSFVNFLSIIIYTQQTVSMRQQVYTKKTIIGFFCLKEIY